MKRFLVRLWGFLPGFLTWITLVGLVILAIYWPLTLAILVLLYAIYWLIKVFIITGHLIVGYIRYRQEVKINWYEKLKKEFPAKYRQLYHLAIIPTYKEDISILRQNLISLKTSNYPIERLIVVVAFEERDKENAVRYAETLTHEFEHHFGELLMTFHPVDIEGEVKGKGPNITWAGRKAKELIDQRRIKYENVIVSTIDADSRVDPNYFANVSWTYLNTPDAIHKSFQPLPLYFNNIWQVPLAVKITALGSSFWQIVQSMRPYYSRNFSTHAQSLAALIETDFWSVRTVVEDGHQYWRSYFRFEGNHSVVPTFVPVYMDAVEGTSLSDTFREQYLQRRRWFWGVSDVPFVFEHSYGNNRIPFFYKWLQFGRLVESHYSLSTQSFVLLMGWFPVIFNADFRQTVLGYSFPVVYRVFLTAAWVGMIANMSIASLLVPPRPGSKASYYLHILIEWILAPVLLPLTGIFFSALPAIDSQTRLMLNKPFTVFNVTKKAALKDGVVRISEN